MQKRQAKILYIQLGPFGIPSDYLYHCKYLKDEFHVAVLCVDTGRRLRQSLPGVHVVHIPGQGSKILRNIRFFLVVLKWLRKDHFDVCFCGDCRFSTIFGLFFGRKNNVIWDIRSGSVSGNWLKRFFFNAGLSFKAKLYRHVTILAESLADKLHIKNYHLIPLGAEEKFFSRKNFEVPHFFYIGTGNKRRLPDTVAAFDLFCDRLPPEEAEKVHYSIVCRYQTEAIEPLQNTVRNAKYGRQITLSVDKRHDEIKALWENCNIGLVYVPITDYYQCQPSTKMFEYVIAGMFSIATETKENLRCGGEKNTMFCKDNPESLADAMMKVYQKRRALNSETIADSMAAFRWQNIVRNNIIPFFRQVLKNRDGEKVYRS